MATVGVFGATGQVGGVMLRLLASRGFPVSELRLFGSERSAGSRLRWGDGEIVVEDAAEADFRGLEIALCSMGSAASKRYAPQIVAAGAVVIDNSSAWRMDPEVPLVVADVNDEALSLIPKGIVANPNCTTMVCMPALAALRDSAGLVRVVASSYQAVSGAGRAGVAELREQIERAGDKASELTFDGSAIDFGEPRKFAAPIAYNVVPVVGSFVDDETDEEHKFRNETRKILGLPHLPVSATCVRVPVFTGHAVSLYVELGKPMSVREAREVLATAPGLRVADLPTPLAAAGTDPCIVGRIRRDPDAEAAISLFVVGDNLRKGAALNAVQIAERLVGRTARV